MKLRIVIVALLLSVLLVACSDESPNNEQTSQEAVDIKELVHDYSVGDISDQTASITSEQLIVTNNEDDSKQVYELPEEEFFVSIAPFINQTHPCEIHSLTGCQGELVNKEFDIYIEDMEGNVIVDEKMSTQANGFIDLWLPWDKSYQVKITHDGKQTESEISTYEDDGTCITTMQLT